ncbi:uncharacterized protein LOC143192498 [Rhynchophorus ferrugineus]|uniref:uncharacterized protein LOC143192498 n=1 Tax=Rhynchophorus ferrugineus TaxID=354439 RepID=UPI003FCCC33E
MVKNFVCRTCLSVIDNEVCVHKINEENVTKEMKIKELLLSYISEIDLNVSKNPVICNDCLNTITGFHTFKNKCVKTENVINLYLKRNNRKKLINLEDVITNKCLKKGNLNISKVRRRPMRFRKSKLKNILHTENLNSVPCDVVDEKLIFMKYLNLASKCNNENDLEEANDSKVIDDSKDNSSIDVSTNSNINKTLYIQLKDCLINDKSKQAFPEQNHVELMESSNVNVSEMTTMNEEQVLPELDASSSLASHQHLTISLRKEVFVSCSYCSKCFSSENEFQQHNRLHHKVCRLCNFTTMTFHKLQAHLKLEHRHYVDSLQNIQGQNLAVNCSLCPNESQLFCCNLRDHRLKNHIKFTGDGYICPYNNCNFMDKIAYLVAKHIELEHDNNLLCCPLCYFSTNSVNKLKRHMVSHSEKIYKCEVCRKGLSNISALESHLRRMHPNYLKGLSMTDVFQKFNHGDSDIPEINYSEYLALDSFVNLQVDDIPDPKINGTKDDCIIVSDSPTRPITIVISDES